MKLLAIDTSGSACSAALWLDGELTQRLEAAPRRHGELILSMMDRLLAEAGLDLRGLDSLAFAHGPGSFTGLRIAAAVVQGAAFAGDLPVVGVSTLAALAQGCRRGIGASRVLCAFDARMDEVYWGVYAADAGGLMQPLVTDAVCAPEAVEVPADDGHVWHGAGSGFAAYREQLLARLGVRIEGLEPQRECEAVDVAILAADAYQRGQARAPEDALPVYLRNRVTATAPVG